MSSEHRFAARGRRRRLAAPFVTTLLLGASSCTSGTSPSTTPPTTKAAVQRTEPPTLVPPLPPPTNVPSQGGADGQVAGNKWRVDPRLPKANGHVTYNRDGTCFGVEKFECAKAKAGKPTPTCNPPPPQAVQCPPQPSPAEIADARTHSFTALKDCGKLGPLPKTFSVEISAAGTCEQVYTIGKLDPKVLDCTRDKLKKLGWPLNTSGYQIEIK